MEQKKEIKRKITPHKKINILKIAKKKHSNVENPHRIEDRIMKSHPKIRGGCEEKWKVEQHKLNPQNFKEKSPGVKKYPESIEVDQKGSIDFGFRNAYKGWPISRYAFFV